MLPLPAVLLSACVAASPPDVEAPTPHPLKVDVPVDAAVVAFGAATWIVSETLAKDALAPDTCRWCDRNAAGVDTLNAVDRAGRALRWGEGEKTADTLSNIGAFGLLPLSAIGLDAMLTHQSGDVRRSIEDLLIVSETATLAAVLNQAIKFAVGRERPFVHALPPEQRPFTEHPSDNNLSFYSGHASFVFSIAVATGVVAEQRGYPHAWLVWAVGMPLAATTAYLRIGADKHYLTDVVTGAVIGSAFGVGIPLLFHPRVDEAAPVNEGLEARIVPTGTGAALVGRF